MSEPGAPEARCHKCGALLAPGAAWCGQCLEPVVQAVAQPPFDEREPYIGDVRMDTGPIRRAPGDDILPPATPSLRGGPTSFGPIAKIVVTALCLLVGGALYALIVALGTLGAAAASAFALVYLSIFVLVGVLFLYQIWKPTPRR
jgi:hypothetical protein